MPTITDLATKADLTTLASKADLTTLEMRLTTRFGIMLAAAVAALAAFTQLA